MCRNETEQGSGAVSLTSVCDPELCYASGDLHVYTWNVVAISRSKSLQAGDAQDSLSGRDVTLVRVYMRTGVSSSEKKLFYHHIL